MAANEQARAAAQTELDADEADYRTLQAAEQDTQRLIQQEIARIKAAEEARIKREAEERARREEEARIKREEAARAKAEAEAAERTGAQDAADKKARADAAAVESARANTIARELHDSVGHALTAIVVQSGAARVQLPEASAETLETIEELARHALGELDGALGALRRGADRDAHGQRGERGRRSGTVDSRGDGPATATLETVISTAQRVLELDARVDSLSGLADDVQ